MNISSTGALYFPQHSALAVSSMHRMYSVCVYAFVGLCSPRHAVRVPIPLLPRPTPRTHRPPQPAIAIPCCTAQQTQRGSRHVSGAVAAGTRQGRGPNTSALQQPAGGQMTQNRSRHVGKKGTIGSRALTLSRGRNENLQSRLVPCHTWHEQSLSRDQYRVFVLHSCSAVMQTSTQCTQ